MRHLSFTAIGLLGAVAVQALVQAPSGLAFGVGALLPRSDIAIGIDGRETPPTLAPTLAASVLADDTTTRDDLRSARASLLAGHAGQAKQSLEMAEIRVIWRPVPRDQDSGPDNSQLVSDIRDIRHALGGDDSVRAVQLIDLALVHWLAAPVPRMDEDGRVVELTARDPFKTPDFPRLILVVAPGF